VQKEGPVKKIDSHNNFIFFTGAVIFLLVAAAFVSSSPEGENHRLLQAVMLLTQLVAYFSLNLSNQWRLFVAVMVVLMLVVNGLREFTEWPAAPLVELFVVLVFYCGMAYVAGRQVLYTSGIEFNHIVGTVAVFLLLGLIWALLYLITLEFWPMAFHGIEYKNWNDNLGAATYFSFITMTSTGYGDITPVLPVTRTLAYLQAITGTFYMAVVVASMVGAFSRALNR
jgi:voltage-gated potassium channel